MAETRPYPIRVVTGVIAAFAIGIVMAVGCDMILATWQDNAFRMSWSDGGVLRVLVAAAPFLFLALCGIVAVRPWIVGFCLTAAFWGYYAVTVMRADPGGGADIGLALVMLFSPVPITIGCLAAWWTVRR